MVPSVKDLKGVSNTALPSNAVTLNNLQCFFEIKSITIIKWLQYYKFKPLQPLFSKCKNNQFIPHTALSNKDLQSCSNIKVTPSIAMGYSIKNPNRRDGLGYTFLKSPTGNFRFVTLPQEIPEKNGFYPWEILQICVTPLGNSKVKNQDPWKFCISFSWTPLEFPLLF